MQIRKDDLLASLPAEWPEDLLPRIQATVDDSRVKIVVVDDDPTGTQTVYDVPVFTAWSTDALARALIASGPIACVLTNTRGMPLAEARAINRVVGANLREASEATGRDFVVVSRSDSTLRGHYPGEVEALESSLGQNIYGAILVPFFLEGGRLTVDDVHYVTEGEMATPAAETEFARDPAFPYHNSRLPDWIREKHEDKISSDDIMSITIGDLRRGGPEVVAARLTEFRRGQVCIVNAASYRDLEVFVDGLLRVEALGRRFIYRTAASFVRARAGLAPRGLLTSLDLADHIPDGPGLIVAGSHIQKSTAQIQAIRTLPNIAWIEVAVERILDAARRDTEIRNVAELANRSLTNGEDTLIYTSRALVAGANRLASLRIGQEVSAALVEIVDRIATRPCWMIAKGGMTSSEIATKALNVSQARALGQSVPGVPIWRTGAESRWPDMLYVVFPGNVGGPEAMVEMIQVLRRR